jgi:hypothetical protein
MGLLGPKLPPEQEFWTWFVANKHKIEADPQNGEANARLLSKRFEKFHKDVVWEIGQVEDGTIELAISADGLKAAAPYARKLADAAPPIPGWKIVAFRQPKPDGMGPIAIEFPGAGNRIGTDTVFVSVSQEGWEYNLDLYHDLPLDTPSEVVSGVMFLLLDTSIGEHAMIYKVGYIEFHPMSEKPDDAIPLDDLRKVIDITQTP